MLCILYRAIVETLQCKNNGWFSKRAQEQHGVGDRERLGRVKRTITNKTITSSRQIQSSKRIFTLFIPWSEVTSVWGEMYFPLLFQVISRGCFHFTPATPIIVHSVLHGCPDRHVISTYTLRCLLSTIHACGSIQFIHLSGLRPPPAPTDR